MYLSLDAFLSENIYDGVNKEKFLFLKYDDFQGVFFLLGFFLFDI